MTALVIVPPEGQPMRPLPCDVETEKHLLAAVIEVPDNLGLVLGKLEPRHFFAMPHRWIFEAVIDLTKNDQGVDYVTIGAWLRDHERLAQIGGALYLNELAFLPAVGNIEAKAERLIELDRARQLLAIGQRIEAQGYAVKAEGVRAYIDESERAVFQLAQQREDRTDVAPISSATTEANHRMLAAWARSGAVELSTGLTDLDKAIGGLGRQRVTVFAARPGMGKTGLAAFMAETLAGYGELVVFFSIEMPRWQLALRMACARVGANAFRAMHGQMGDQERALVFGSAAELSELPIWIDETPTCSLQHIRSKARLVEAKAKRKLGAIFVDYLQLIRAPRERGVTRDEQLSDVTAGLKRLAKEMDCAVVYLSQLNREVEKRADKHPILSDLRESGGIEQDADDIVFIYRPDYYDKSQSPGTAELVIAKQRNGPTDTVKVRFNAASVAFGDL